MLATETSQQLLEEFLSYPLNMAEDIFARFESLPGAVSGKGEHPLERYVCIPGTRENKIVLVAHADTVWDDAYGKPAQTTVTFEDGCFKSTNPNCGIGADDRAGCAMLWALRDSGHTILLVNGEEKGKWGAKFLCKKVCGVNIGVGYQGWHRPTESLSLADWENTLARLTDFLKTAHPRFPLSFPKKVRHFLARIKGKIVKILKGSSYK